MNQAVFLFALVFFAVGGVVFLNQGLTGMVVSESCCFGPSCSAENLCASAKAVETYNHAYPQLFVGLASVGMLYMTLIIKKHSG